MPVASRTLSGSPSTDSYRVDDMHGEMKLVRHITHLTLTLVLFRSPLNSAAGVGGMLLLHDTEISCEDRASIGYYRCSLSVVLDRAAAYHSGDVANVPS